MNGSITVKVPKRMPLSERVSEVAGKVRDWLDSLEVAFNDERDKLQLSGWHLSDDGYRYDYSIIRGRTVSAGKVNDLEEGKRGLTSGLDTADLEMDDSLFELSP